MTSFKIKQPKQRCCVHVAVSFHSGFVFSGGGPEEVCAKRTHLLTPVSITAEKEKREKALGPLKPGLLWSLNYMLAYLLTADFSTG